MLYGLSINNINFPAFFMNTDVQEKSSQIKDKKNNKLVGASMEMLS